MKAIYITLFFLFLCFYTTKAMTPEKEALWNELNEIKNVINNENIKKALGMLHDLEKHDLSNYPDLYCLVQLYAANCYIQLDQLSISEDHLDKAEALIGTYALDSLKANLYRQKGLTYRNKLDFKSSIRLYLEGLGFAEAHTNEIEKMLLSYNLGLGYVITFNLDSAKYFINKSLKIANRDNHLTKTADCKALLGEIEKNEGNLIKAMEYYFEAYRIAKSAKGNTEYTRYLYLDRHLFDIYVGLGNLSSSLERVNFMIEQKRTIQNLFNIDGHLLAKSFILMRMDSLEASVSVLDELEQSYESVNSPKFHNQITALRGGLMYKSNHLEAAEKELSKLLPELDSASLKSPVEKIALQGLSYLALLKSQKGAYKNSISICEDQLQNKRLGYDLKKQFYGTLAACYKGLGNHDAAYKYLLQRDAVRDTINRFYEGTLRLSKEQELLDQQKADEIERLKFKNELSQFEATQQQNLIYSGGLFALLFSGMLFLWGRQRKLVLENDLADVKQKLLKLQVNPHFIFNVLNSIQNSVLKLKKEKSIELISKFSKLTRQILQNSDRVMVPIHEELLLLTNYMDLEKIRTQNKFDYEVMIDEGIDVYNSEIPSMILQLFVENAIWHGIIPKEEQGLITLKIEKEAARIRVTIEDDGIGRTMSEKLKTKDQQKNVSMGMRLIKQRVLTLNKKHKSNIELYIKDRMNGQGTQALLIV